MPPWAHNPVTLVQFESPLFMSEAKPQHEEHRSVIIVSAEVYDKIVKLIESPSKPSPAMIKAAKEYLYGK